MSRRLPFLQFSLRAFLAALAFVTVGLAISSAYIRRGERQRYIIAEVQRLGGTIFYADERVAFGYERNYVSQKEKSRLRKLLGEGYYRKIDFVDISAADEVPDRLFAALAALPSLRGIQVAPAVSQYPGVALVQRAHPRLEIHAEWQPLHTFGKLIATPEDFDAELAKDHCVLFVDGDWSFTAVAFRPVLARFANSWTAKGEKPSISFATLDFSTPQAQNALYPIAKKWMVSQSLEREGSKSLYHVGIVIWIENGRAKAFRWNVHELSQEELFEITREAFAAKARG